MLWRSASLALLGYWGELLLLHCDTVVGNCYGQWEIEWCSSLKHVGIPRLIVRSKEGGFVSFHLILFGSFHSSPSRSKEMPRSGPRRLTLSFWVLVKWRQNTDNKNTMTQMCLWVLQRQHLLKWAVERLDYFLKQTGLQLGPNSTGRGGMKSHFFLCLST